MTQTLPKRRAIRSWMHWRGVVVMSGAAVLALIWVVYRCCLRRQLGHHALLRRNRGGVLRIELRRGTGLCSHADGLGGQSFPQPIETRLLCLVFCELPIWIRRESIALPVGSEADFARIGATDYDHRFSAAFSIAAPGPQASRSPSAASG